MRVVAGRLRGRRLSAGPARGQRPTSERVRAGMFDWLGAEVREARVLDLFAGCGGLGIEALSRGALSAVFVERDVAARRALRANLAALGLEEESLVVGSDVRRILEERSALEGPFELILADPPYGEGWGERLVQAARLRDLLAPGGVFLAERSARDAQPAAGPGLRLRGTKRYGETAIDWFDREESA